MCAIVDNNVAIEVFGKKNKSLAPAAEFFRLWIFRRGSLVVGGKLADELRQHTDCVRAIRELIRRGRARRIDRTNVNDQERQLNRRQEHVSDDPHILALALTSGARLLYTNDKDLIRDFGNHRLISKPRGRVYTTNRSKRVTPTHRSLLARTDLCSNST